MLDNNFRIDRTIEYGFSVKLYEINSFLFFVYFEINDHVSAGENGSLLAVIQHFQLFSVCWLLRPRAV